jgi:hypothetical protein
MGGSPVISCEGRQVLQRTRVRQVFQRGVERVLFIGTQFSILYTFVYSPA